MMKKPPLGVVLILVLSVVAAFAQAFLESASLEVDSSLLHTKLTPTVSVPAVAVVHTGMIIPTSNNASELQNTTIALLSSTSLASISTNSSSSPPPSSAQQPSPSLSPIETHQEGLLLPFPMAVTAFIVAMALL